MEDAETRPRPRHLIVTGIVTLLWNSMGAVDYTLSATRNEAYLSQFSPEMLAYVNELPAWAMGAWGLGVWGAVLGSALLLARKRFAYPVFVASLVGVVAMNVYSYLIANWLEVSGGGGSLVFSIAIFLVALALVLYSRAMARQGVLT